MTQPADGHMLAAVIQGPGGLAIRTIPIPIPNPTDVLVRVEFCGICGTDLHSVLDGWAPPGTIPGHEWSGQVVAVGTDVGHLAIGDRVVGGPATCGVCEWCVAGRPSLCVTDPLRRGVPPHNGAFAEYHLAAASSVVPVPWAVSARTAALAEPLAVALHGLSLAQLPDHPGSTRVLVSGAGPLGLLVIAALADRGFADVTVSEPAAARRTQALAVGATVALPPDELPTEPAAPTHCTPDGYDVCLETSGVGDAITTGLNLLRPMGRLVLLGTNAMSVRVDPLRILLNELVVTGAYCYDAHGIAAALDLLATGRLPIDALVGPDDFSLDDLLPTMQRLHDGDLSTKALVKP